MPSNKPSQASNQFDFTSLTHDPNVQNLIHRGLVDTDFLAPFNQPNTSINQLLRTAGAMVNANLGGFSTQALPLGFSTLLDVLASQGKTDPRLMNRTISETQRGTQRGVDAVGQRAAQAGLTGSGAVAAVQAAREAAGNRQIADIHAQEAQDQEARKRSDLGLMLELLINPVTGLLGAERSAQTSQNAINAQQSANRRNSTLQALGTVATIASLFCWVAREVLQDDRWKDVQHYMLHLAPPKLMVDYANHGEELASRVKDDDELREALLPVFEKMAEAGRAHREVA